MTDEMLLQMLWFLLQDAMSRGNALLAWHVWKLIIASPEVRWAEVTSALNK